MMAKKPQIIEHVEAKVSEAEKVQSASALNRTQAELRAMRSAYKEALGQIASLEQQVQIASGWSEPKRLRTKKPKRQQADGEAAFGVVLTDWHAEEVVDPETVNGINEHNLEIHRQRVANLWPKCIQLLEANRVMSQIDEVWVWLLGDMFSSHLHPELVEGNELGPMEAVQMVRSEIVTGVDYLWEHSGVKRMNVCCNWGNHGRTTDKVRHSTGYTHSLEWLMYSDLADRYARAKSPVEWHVEKGMLAYSDVKGWKVRSHHGYGIRYQGGVGGLTIPLNKAIAKWNSTRQADYDLFGHWHTFDRGWKWVSCPCLIGYSAYALSLKAEKQPPAQTALVFDRERGLVYAEPIFVD